MAEDPMVNVLWIPAGLSCDGDSVALTAAMQPAIEEIALGAFPGLPGVVFHWPLIAYSLGGEEFLQAFFKAERGELDPFVLVIEGSIANEADQERRLLDRLRQQAGHRPADDVLGVDRRARAQGVGGARGRDVRDVRRHPRDGRKSDGRHGHPRLPRLGLEVERRRPDRVRSGLSDAARQPVGDDPLSAMAGRRPRADDSARRGGPSARGCSAVRFTKGATAPAITSRASSRRSTTRRSVW